MLIGILIGTSLAITGILMSYKYMVACENVDSKMDSLYQSAEIINI